jgi:hypothetical protein
MAAAGLTKPHAIQLQMGLGGGGQKKPAGFALGGAKRAKPAPALFVADSDSDE